MKTRLLETMAEIIELLTNCGEDDEASWFRSQLKVLRETDCASEESRRALAEVDNAIAGMGSFSDISLRPKKGSKLTARQAKDKQWALVEQLGDAIDELISRRDGRKR